MAVLQPMDSISGLKFPSVADTTFSTANREAMALGTQLGAQALESAAFLKGKQLDYNYLRQRDDDNNKIVRRATIINALTNGLGAVDLVGAQRRNAGDALNAGLLQMAMDPNRMLAVANQTIAGVNQFRASVLPSVAGTATTAGSILRSGGVA